MSATDTQPPAAEYSLIGSLLQRPDLAHIVGRWLRASDFADPWMGRAYHALVEQGLYRHPEVTAAGPGYRQHALTPLLVAQMQANAPMAGDSFPDYYWDRLREMLTDQVVHPVVTPEPDGALTYGRAVLWDKVRRTVQTGGEILSAAAEYYGNGMGGVGAAADAGIEEVDDLRRRWEDAAPAWLTPEPTEQLPLIAPPVPQNPESDLLLASLILSPDRVGAVRSFITPNHIGGEYGPDLYRRILAADDERTNLWQDPQQLTSWALQVRAQHGCTDAGSSRSEVHKQATAVMRAYVRHVASSGGSLISQWAAQGVGATRQVLGAAQRVFGTVARHVQRDAGLGMPAAFAHRGASR